MLVVISSLATPVAAATDNMNIMSATVSAVSAAIASAAAVIALHWARHPVPLGMRVYRTETTTEHSEEPNSTGRDIWPDFTVPVPSPILNANVHTDEYRPCRNKDGNRRTYAAHDDELLPQLPLVV
eukprot:jgi/Chlat1/3922/Chrsp26S04027